MNSGDIVIPNASATLYSGCDIYSHAVVASTKPLVLVSEEGDMLWRKFIENDFRVIAKASEKIMNIVNKRIKEN